MPHNPTLTLSTNYQKGCRCAPCRAAKSRANADSYKRHPPTPSATIRHGRAKSYRLGCRCPACTVANAAHQNALYHQKKGKVKWTCGTLYGYNYGACRCAKCKSAKRAWQQDYYARKAA